MKTPSAEVRSGRPPLCRPHRYFSPAIFCILLGTCLLAASSAPAQVDTEAPVIEIADVEVTKLGTDHYSFTFYFLANDNEGVTGIEFRGAVDRGALDSWKPWPYLGPTYPFPIQLNCWAFDFEVRAVDAAGNRSVPAQWSFGELRAEPIIPANPVIQGPSGAKGKVDENFRFKFRAEGSSRYKAIGLPRGLAVNRRTGWITGKPERRGNYRVVLIALKSNASSRKIVMFRISE